MKVPNKVLDIVTRLANSEQVSPEDRATVLLWAQEGRQKRESAKVEAARQLLATASK